MLRRVFPTLALAIVFVPIACEADNVMISSYFDDPFVTSSVIKGMDPAEFGQAVEGRPTLWSNHVWVTDEDFIFRRTKTGYSSRSRGIRGPSLGRTRVGISLSRMRIGFPCSNRFAGPITRLC